MNAALQPRLFVTLLTLAVMTAPIHVSASELGRLFYTPQERAQLEAQQTSGATPEGVKRNFIVVNGVIQKQGGNRIVWLNGEAQSAVRANNNPASIDVAIPGKSKHVQVKVGQRLMLDTSPPTESDNSSQLQKSDD